MSRTGSTNSLKCAQTPSSEIVVREYISLITLLQGVMWLGVCGGEGGS
jgi:hypothetical protein